MDEKRFLLSPDIFIKIFSGEITEVVFSLFSCLLKNRKEQDSPQKYEGGG